MFQAEVISHLGNITGLIGIELKALSNFDRAKAAATRTSIAEDHERCSLLAPAFWQVRASRTLTDRVQALSPHHILNVLDCVRTWKADR